MRPKPATRYCLLCDEILQGRADKKFCNDYCRNTFNNNLKSSIHTLLRGINSILIRNRRALETLLPNNEKSIKTTKHRLLSLGFRFDYITHQRRGPGGKIYSFCYDYGYVAIKGGWYLLVRDSLDRI